MSAFVAFVAEVGWCSPGRIEMALEWLIFILDADALVVGMADALVVGMADAIGKNHDSGGDDDQRQKQQNGHAPLP